MAAKKKTAKRRGMDQEERRTYDRVAYSTQKQAGRARPSTVRSPEEARRINEMVTKGLRGTAQLAKEYPTKRGFVQAMTDAIGEGNLGSMPSSKWRPLVERRLGTIYDSRRKTKRK